mgnify:CR=1 FL=1
MLLALIASVLAQDPAAAEPLTQAIPAAGPEALTIPSGLLGDIGYVLAILGGTSSFGLLSLKGLKAGAARIGEALEKLTTSMTTLINEVLDDMRDGKPMTINITHTHVIHLVEYHGEGEPPPVNGG